MRKLHINGKVYQYKVGKGGSNVTVKFPTSEKVTFDGHEITGRSGWTMEKGQYKGTSDGMITPGQIKTFLLRLLESPKAASDTGYKTPA